MTGATTVAEWVRARIRAKKDKPIPAHVNFFYCFGGLSLFLIILQATVISHMIIVFYLKACRVPGTSPG